MIYCFLFDEPKTAHAWACFFERRLGLPSQVQESRNPSPEGWYLYTGAYAVLIAEWDMMETHFRRNHRPDVSEYYGEYPCISPSILRKMDLSISRKKKRAWWIL